MFWRHDCCYYCWHHYRHLSFRRGMASLLILAIVVYALLHAPGLASHRHPARAHTSHLASHQGARHHLTSGRPRPGHQKPPPPARAPHPGRRSQVATPARSGQSHRPPASSRVHHSGTEPPLNWTNFHGIELPTSTAAGPRYTRNGLAIGFAHSQTGALLAAINIAVRTAAQWGPAIFRPTITHQVTGPNSAALLRADTNAYAQLHGTSRTTDGHPASNTHAVERAYRFVAYAPASAIVNVVTVGPGANGTPVLVMSRLHVVWLHGDWRLVAPPEGDWANAATAISSLAGYTLLTAER